MQQRGNGRKKLNRARTKKTRDSRKAGPSREQGRMQTEQNRTKERMIRNRADKTEKQHKNRIQ